MEISGYVWTAATCVAAICNSLTKIRAFITLGTLTLNIRIFQHFRHLYPTCSFIFASEIWLLVEHARTQTSSNISTVSNYQTILLLLRSTC